MKVLDVLKKEKLWLKMSKCEFDKIYLVYTKYNGCPENLYKRHSLPRGMQVSRDVVLVTCINDAAYTYKCIGMQVCIYIYRYIGI